MERRAFQLLHDAEASWWYQARKIVVERVLARYAKTGLSILDLGAGFGGMAASLRTFGTVDAFEPDSAARGEAKSRAYRHVLSVTSHEELPSLQYQLIALLDVLEHTEDDARFLASLKRVLTKDGSLIITVPAFQFLWSAHDVAHHHYRRYNKTALRTLLEAQGFAVEYVSYWNTLLFLPAAILRLLGRSGESSLTPNSLINRIFFAIVKSESKCIPRYRLPFGTGLICYATKK